MSVYFGDSHSLRASEKSALERLANKRSNPSEVIDSDLARQAAKLAASLGAYIGLLLGRDGRVAQVVLGSKTRLYLPDLGRFRLNQARLRRLRLVVLVPDGERILQQHGSHFNGSGRDCIAPTIANDLLTDLEKLRLDLVAVFAVTGEGALGPVSVAHLDPAGHHNDRLKKSNGRHRAVLFHHAKDIHALKLNCEELVSSLEAEFTVHAEQGFEVGKDRAILVGAYMSSLREANASMEELTELARTAGVSVVDTLIQRRKKLDPKTLIGVGKIEEIVLQSLDLGANLLIFDRELAPGQLRSITKATDLRVIDRSMLILDIFAQRATSSEGRLQVELAQLKYSLPRLTETDSGLSRLTGGIGGRGPGETKLEISRRRIRDRIADLEKRIDRLACQREVRRNLRQSRGVPVVAIVGYTNAGKSTLLNALTKGEVLVESKLFATLDPSSRRMRFPNDKEVIFVDTVGFIRELPKELVSAFRATLEEVGEADLLVQVVDASNPEMKEQIDVVSETLASLGYGDKPKILVLNKTDLLSEIEVQMLKNSLGALAISALKRDGFVELISRVQDSLLHNFSGQDPGRFTEMASW